MDPANRTLLAERLLLEDSLERYAAEAARAPEGPHRGFWLRQRAMVEQALADWRAHIRWALARGAAEPCRACAGKGEGQELPDPGSLLGYQRPACASCGGSGLELGE